MQGSGRVAGESKASSGGKGAMGSVSSEKRAGGLGIKLPTINKNANMLYLPEIETPGSDHLRNEA